MKWNENSNATDTQDMACHANEEDTIHIDAYFEVLDEKKNQQQLK